MKRWFVVLSFVACGGSTGGTRVTFAAFASGPVDATPALTFETRAGYRVQLDQAQLHIGALYFNEGQPVAGAQETGCVLQSTYVAQVLGGCDVDLLSPNAVPFAVSGSGLSRPAATAQVWFADRDVNAADDDTQVLLVSGSASKNSVSYPFSGQITIGKNRMLSPLNPAMPGSNPICKQRIVSGLAASFTPAAEGSVLLRVDPRPWFATLNFSQLPRSGAASVIADTLSDSQSSIFFSAFKAHGGYHFSWSPSSTP